MAGTPPDEAALMRARQPGRKEQHTSECTVRVDVSRIGSCFLLLVEYEKRENRREELMFVSSPLAVWLGLSPWLVRRKRSATRHQQDRYAPKGHGYTTSLADGRRTTAPHRSPFWPYLVFDVSCPLYRAQICCYAENKGQPNAHRWHSRTAIHNRPRECFGSGDCCTDSSQRRVDRFATFHAAQ